MMRRVLADISEEHLRTLIEIAFQERRPPRDQAGVLLQEAIDRAGRRLPAATDTGPSYRPQDAA
jgi:hypothetical protein